MQSQKVGWDPTFIDHQMPWQSRFFLFYLLFLIVISLVRTTRMVRYLWLLRGLSSTSEIDARFLPLHDACSAKIRSMERSVVLTFLLCVLMAADQMRVVLAAMAVEKYAPIAYLSASIAEVLAVFAIGVLVCTALYALSDFIQGRLTRRRSLWNAAVARKEA